MALRRMSALLIYVIALFTLAAATLLPLGSVGAEECGPSQHPSGNDRCDEEGGSSPQGNAQSDPDDDGRGPDRSNRGVDQDEGAESARSQDSNAADRDSNNGCGNDQDFEDDNEGLCTQQARDEAKADRDTNPPGGSNNGGGSDQSVTTQSGNGSGNGLASDGAALDTQGGPSAGADDAAGTGATGAGSDALGFAPTPVVPADQTGTGSAAVSGDTGEAIAAGGAAPAAGPDELPATGANVAAQLLGALASLTLGGAALRRGSRPVGPEPWLRG